MKTRVCLMSLVALCLLACNQQQESVSTGTWPEETAKMWRASGVKDVENVAPMGVVPEWAKERMTPEEYDAWKVVAKVYCVDYSFLKHERFPEERASIYESAKMTADAILAKPDSFTIQRGALFMYSLDPKVTHPSHREAPKVELRKDGSLRVQAYECPDFICYADVVYEKQKEGYKVHSKKLSYSVNGVTDSGYLLEVIIEPDGDAVVILMGFFHYKGEAHDVAIVNHFNVNEVEKK